MHGSLPINLASGWMTFFCLLYRSLSHLEKAGGTVRIMFLDFSCAHNTIQPSLLRDKFEQTRVDHNLTAWVMDYLINSPESVGIQDCESDVVVCSMGVPQGTLMAFLFTLYTADVIHKSANCQLQKLSDNSAIISLITDGDGREYQKLTQGCVDCCQWKCLQINAGQTLQ